MNTPELKKSFENPALEYRMQPLFRVNDEIDPKEVQWQIRSLKEQGFGGIFSICEVFHDGAPDKFLSDWWWNAVDVLAKACAEEGLEFLVYDDEDWPMGSLGVLLIKDDPEWNWHYL
ncbi:MAG: hypothetical protein KC964_27770, partial [Candidatus Omnitrophica bacterium]|nr:hypothetical protein [Candidatus Omnitrophota bacterium]